MTRRPIPLTTPGLTKLPDVHLSREHLASTVRSQFRSGTWTRLARGVYVPVLPGETEPERRRRFALARVVALATVGSADKWASHVSAALLWGLPSHRTPLVSHLTYAHRPHAPGEEQADVVRHHLHLPAEDRARVLGVPVTSVARTIVDCARIESPETTLVLADAALNRHLDSPQLDEALARIGSRPGAGRARALLAFADSGAESPPETLLRLVMVGAGLPVPETQIAVETAIGTFWGDLGWRRWRFLLEYDGRSKYAQHGTEELIREKRRHDAIVEAGYTILHVTKERLAAPAALVRHVTAELVARGASTGPPPRGLRG